ncbi:MAG: hypothetical protein JSW08_01600 [archaeon]|nr:MAG: hypothetical protein JSW08_01600 [archaeon]
MELQCQKCKYQFNSERLPNLCPFCGALNMVRNVPSASEILMEAAQQEEKQKEVEQRREEWKKRISTNQD